MALDEDSDSESPIVAWEALAEALTAPDRSVDLNKAVIPAWVLPYFRDAAVEMCRIWTGPDGVPSKDKLAPAVAAALKLSRKVMRKRSHRAHALMVASDVYRAETKNWSDQRKGVAGTGARVMSSHAWDSIFEDVARSHRCGGCQRKKLSKATVKRFWYQFRHDVTPPDVADSQKRYAGLR